MSTVLLQVVLHTRHERWCAVEERLQRTAAVRAYIVLHMYVDVYVDVFYMFVREVPSPTIIRSRLKVQAYLVKSMFDSPIILFYRSRYGTQISLGLVGTATL